MAQRRERKQVLLLKWFFLQTQQEDQRSEFTNPKSVTAGNKAQNKCLQQWTLKILVPQASHHMHVCKSHTNPLSLSLKEEKT